MEDINQDFKCINCGKTVTASGQIGTKNRNHCPFCLTSKHVDDKIAGDRQASCHGQLKVIGLTYKNEGVDKYGKSRQGELMLIHNCLSCGKLSINRIAADDNTDLILSLLDSELPKDKAEKLKTSGIQPLDTSDSDQVKTLLFGKKD